jgi:hypothetical protein
MDLDVLLKVRSSRELLPTVLAFERFFTKMNFNMAAEIRDLNNNKRD